MFRTEEVSPVEYAGLHDSVRREAILTLTRN